MKPFKKTRDDSLPGRSHHLHFLNSSFASRVLHKLFFYWVKSMSPLFAEKHRKIFTTTFLIFQFLHLKDLQEHPGEVGVGSFVYPIGSEKNPVGNHEGFSKKQGKNTRNGVIRWNCHMRRDRFILLFQNPKP